MGDKDVTKHTNNKKWKRILRRWDAFVCAIVLIEFAVLLFLFKREFLRIEFGAIMVFTIGLLMLLGVILKPLKKNEKPAEENKPAKRPIKEYEPKQVARAREALLNYLGSQVRTHTTNIFTIVIAIFSSFQLYNLFERTLWMEGGVFIIKAIHLAVFSALLTILIWQVIRVIYYSNLVSNAIVAKPFPLTEYPDLIRSEDYSVSLIRRIYNRADRIIEGNRAILVRLAVGFRTLNPRSFLKLFAIFILIFIISTVLFNYELITFLARAWTMLP